MKVMSLITRRKIMGVARGMITAGSGSISPPSGQKFITGTQNGVEMLLTGTVNGIEQPLTGSGT